MFSTVAKLAAIAGVAMTMSAVSTTASSANDAHAYAKEVFDCYVLLLKNDPSRVEKCGVGDAIFNKNSAYTGTGFRPAPQCAPWEVLIKGQCVCVYEFNKPS